MPDFAHTVISKIRATLHVGERITTTGPITGQRVPPPGLAATASQHLQSDKGRLRRGHHAQKHVPLRSRCHGGNFALSTTQQQSRRRPLTPVERSIIHEFPISTQFRSKPIYRTPPSAGQVTLLSLPLHAPVSNNAARSTAIPTTSTNLIPITPCAFSAAIELIPNHVTLSCRSRG